MKFEYDPQKSQANREKHGIDFEVAQKLWDDPDAIGFPARSGDEERFALLGLVREKLWMAFYARRSGRIRLISVRRARIDERKLYEGK